MQPSRSCKNFSNFKIFQNLNLKLFKILLSLNVKFYVVFVFRDLLEQFQPLPALELWSCKL
jgi:hypothetical protein